MGKRVGKDGNLATGIQSIVMRNSANVISAKARALYGRALKPRDFQNMISCHSVGEVAAYLKNTPAYGPTLAAINESTIHRGHLEQLLRRHLYEEYVALGRYDAAAGKQAYNYIMIRTEIELIINAIQLINAGTPDDILFAIPMMSASHVRLNLPAIRRCTSWSELVSALEHTRYYKPLSKFDLPENEMIPLTEIETVLYTELVQESFNIISHFHGTVRSELEDLLCAQADAQNLNRILRLKKFFDAAPEEIRKNLLPYGMLSHRIMDSMIDAGKAEEVVDIFLSTRLGRRIPKNQRLSIYDIDQRIPYFNARRHIHHSAHPIVTMFSYMIIKDVELNDITNVIEGIRYGLPPEQISGLLVPIA